MYRQLNRPIRLLLVEDNPADVHMLQYGLKEADALYSLQVVTDGEQALQLLDSIRASSQSRPDLIFLDLNLPKRSGHELLSIIKDDSDLRLIPVVVLSSSRAPADIISAYREGANSYLQKPSSLDATLDLLRTIQHYWLDLAFLPVS